MHLENLLDSLVQAQEMIHPIFGVLHRVRQLQVSHKLPYLVVVPDTHCPRAVLEPKDDDDWTRGSGSELEAASA